ncbi:MAG: hydrogen gas-evolving membrane-bound hydrogenase subunit E [Elusimicrobiota bacterium]
MIELILVLKIIAAIIALESKNLLSSIISLGGVGFGLAIVMLFMAAPDVAIVQILVEVVLLIILIRSTINRDHTEVKCQKEFFALVSGGAFLGILLVFVILSIQDLPALGSGLAERTETIIPSLRYLSGSLENTGAPNVVNSVLLSYRGYDTLGEAAILFAAIIGALTILRKSKTEESLKNE